MWCRDLSGVAREKMSFLVLATGLIPEMDVGDSGRELQDCSRQSAARVVGRGRVKAFEARPHAVVVGPNPNEIEVVPRCDLERAIDGVFLHDGGMNRVVGLSEPETAEAVAARERGGVQDHSNANATANVIPRGVDAEGALERSQVRWARIRG